MNTIHDTERKVNMHNKTALSEQNLKDFAAKFAQQLQIGDVICLYGDLGAGKTTFARILIRHIMNDAELEVPSPTFTIVQQYNAPKIEIWHFDLYRLSYPDEILEIGFDEALSQGVSLIEWPDRLGNYMPNDRLECYIDFIKDDEMHRKITLKPYGSWEERLENIDV